MAPPSQPARFDSSERTQLLLAVRIGPKLVEHPERVGFTSIAQMRVLGARKGLAKVSATSGLPNCANRTRTVERALWQGGSDAPPLRGRCVGRWPCPEAGGRFGGTDEGAFHRLRASQCTARPYPVSGSLVRFKAV